MSQKRGEEAKDLNLVPIMNLVTILIPFLLMAAQFVSYAVVDSTAPAISPTPDRTESDDEEPLLLSVLVSPEGFAVTGNHPELSSAGEGEDGVVIPCLVEDCAFDRASGEGAASAYDVRELRDVLGRIKDDRPDEETVMLVPDATLPYEVLVLAMDATREDPDAGDAEGSNEACNGRCLFPMVVIAGGVETASR